MFRAFLTLAAFWLSCFPVVARTWTHSNNPVLVTTAYEGFAYDDGGTVRGTMTVSAKAAVKKAVDPTAMGVSYTTNWTFTAKALLQNATVSFSGKAVGMGERVALTAKTGETLDVALGAGAFQGTLSGGVVGGTLNVAGAPNAFADRTDTAAQARLDAVKGAYNVALVEAGAFRGYLSLTVGSLGAVNYAGRLADGTSITGSAKLLQGLSADGGYAVALYRPLYTEKGFVGGLLWLSPEDKAIRVDTTYGWLVDWVKADPETETFERGLDVVGGVWNGQSGMQNLRFGVSVPASMPPPATGLAGSWVEEAFPCFLPVTVSDTKWTLPKATAPKMTGVTYTYIDANPSGATLAYTAKTGLFKGIFKLYYDGTDTRGKALHRTVSVPYAGLMVPQEGTIVGHGLGTVTINTAKVTLPVTLGEARFLSAETVGNEDGADGLALEDAHYISAETAYQSHLDQVWVMGQGSVTRLLADDTDGDRHQRFIIALPSGQTVLVAHNIDIAPRVPNIAVGDIIRFCGEYIWSDLGGTVHWTHHRNAPGDAGWLEKQGRRYE